MPRAEPTSLPDSWQPRCRIELYQDPNGNWFAGVEVAVVGGYSRCYTPTYPTPGEAVLAVMADAGVRVS